MSTGKVIIDAEELRLFARLLKEFSGDLNNNSNRLQAQFRRLGDTWRDPAYAQFAQEFDQTMRNLKRFLQISEQVIPELLKTAERVDAVHQRS